MQGTGQPEAVLQIGGGVDEPGSPCPSAWPLLPGPCLFFCRFL